MGKFKISSILLTIFAVFLFACQNNQQSQSILSDSLLLQTVHAQSNTANSQQVSHDISTSRQNAITLAVAKASPAVVGISVLEIRKYRYRQRNPFFDDPLWRQLFPELYRDRIYEQPVQSLGSGFIISSDGYILTNDHVAGDGSEILITLPGGEQHKAELVGTDHESDISLLKIDHINLPTIKMGNSNELIVGEWVIALGNPFGLFELSNQPTVTVGVISAINRDWGRMPESGRVYMDMIQTDAAINHGNSGGPLVNSLGEVIGMNTFIYTGSQYQEGFIGIGFAIPINRIHKIVNDIKKKGQVNRNFEIGFRLQNLNQVLIRALDLKVNQGVIVTQIDPGTSADKAGFQLEDVIISLNGKMVRNTDQIINLLTDMDLQVGDILNFNIIRNGKEMQIKMKLIEKR
jgi:serine protease Do